MKSPTRLSSARLLIYVNVCAFMHATTLSLYASVSLVTHEASIIYIRVAVTIGAIPRR